MATKMVGVRLEEETIRNYARVADLLGVSANQLMREMIENGEPLIRELGVTFERVKGGDRVGVVEAFRRLAENRVSAGASVVAELRELENEQKADRRCGSPAVGGGV